MKILRRIATRLSAVLVVIIASSAVLTGIAITRSGTNLLIGAAQENLAQELRLVEVRLQDILQAAAQDIEFIAASPSVADVAATLVDNTGTQSGSTINAQVRARLQDTFAAMLYNHPWYMQVRLIGTADKGREVVRVERAGDRIKRVATADLLQTGDQEYFQKALDEPPGKVYWSRIEISHEQLADAGAPQPVLRAAMPVAGRYGAPVGIVIINININNVFHSASSILAKHNTLYIANADGDYLYHPDPDKVFGFATGQRHLLQDDFTSAALRTVGKDTLVLESVQPAGTSEPMMATLASMRLKATGGDSILLALTRPRQLVLAHIDSALEQGIELITPFLLLALVVVIWMVELFIGPLERVTREVGRYTPGRRMHVPEQTRKDEVGQLALACVQMSTRINEQVLELEEQGVRFRSLFDAAPDAVIIIDENGSIEYSNPSTEKLFGYNNEELTGRNISMLMPEPYRSNHDNYMQRYLAGGVAHVIGIGRKVVGLHRSGRTVPLYLSIGEFNLRGRRKFTGILHDISRGTTASNRAPEESIEI